jgi:hypothetical protein
MVESVSDPRNFTHMKEFWTTVIVIGFYVRFSQSIDNHLISFK